MTIKVGDRMPSVTLTRMTADGPKPVSTDELFAGRTVALLAVPGAFTPTCSARHLPGFIDKAGELRARGIDEIVCVAVNDVFVMDAWGRAAGADGKVTMVADGNGAFARALGLDLDATGFGMGQRSKRFSMLVRDGVVAVLNIDESGFGQTSAEHLLTQI